MLTPASCSSQHNKIDLQLVTPKTSGMNLRSLLPCRRLCQQVFCKPPAQRFGFANMPLRMPVIAAAGKAGKGTGNPVNNAEQKVRTRLILGRNYAKH